MPQQHINRIIILSYIWLVAFFSLAQASSINDTGINTCSNSTQNGLSCPVSGFPSQDAENGTNSFNFTKIDAGGMPLPNTATDHSCIWDNVTGLIWEIKSSDGGLRDKNWTYTWYDSTAPNGSPGTSNGGTCHDVGRCDTEKYIQDINATRLCGFNDWRLPNIKELVGIVDYSRSNPGPVINTNYFPNTLNTYFWSSTPYIRNSTDMWVVGFDKGYTSTRGDKDAIRLVRGTPTITQFTDNGNGTVTDSATGLMWEKCSEGQTVSGSSCTGSISYISWDAALTAARNSQLGSYSDWRLPNAKELQSLVDYTRYGPSINRTMFPNTPTALFWTSSPDASASNLSLVTEFNYGYLNTSNIANRTYGNAVRLVRAGNQSLTYALSVGKLGAGSGTIISSPAGINCGTNCSAAYTLNTSVTLTANQSPTSTFSSWSGDCSGSATTCTISITAAKGVFATFNPAANTNSLNVTKTGNGSGTITSNPSGIDCGTDCTEPYTSSTSVTLIATPTLDSAFAGWTGDCSGITSTCVVNMSTAKNVTATFSKKLTLTITKSGNGSGSVTSSPAGIDCGSDCTEQYAPGTVITLLTVPATGSTFTGWSGDADCTDGQVTIDTNKTCIANFSNGVVYSNNFTNGAGAEWSNRATSTSNGEAFLADSPYGFGALSDTLTLNNLPTHTALAISFDLYIIQSWDGNGPLAGPDNWQLTADGNNVFLSNFANYSSGNTQAYPYQLPPYGTGGDFAPYTGAYATGHLGYGNGNFGDATYRISYTIAHTAPTVAFTFTGMENQLPGDEGWGLDNVMVTTINTAGAILSVTKTGTGNGIVTSTPAGIDCGTDCTESYNVGTSVTLTATPATASSFTGWAENCTGTSLTCTLNMTATKSVTAIFAAASATVTPNIGKGGSVNPSVTQTVISGATQSFTVTSATGYIKSPKGIGGTCPQGSWNGNVYTTGAIITNCSVNFDFLCLACIPDRGGWRAAIKIN